MAVSVIDAVNVFNSQPHVDEIRATALEEMIAGRGNKEAYYGYCLQHKHFSLSEGETMLFTFDSDMIDARVVRLDDITAAGKCLFPVMYYTVKDLTSDELVLVPVGYSLNAKDALPPVPQAELIEGVGICSFAFAKGWLERTDEKNRIQRFTADREPVKGVDMITQIFPCIKNTCSSWCETHFNGSHGGHHSYS